MSRHPHRKGRKRQRKKREHGTRRQRRRLVLRAIRATRRLLQTVNQPLDTYLYHRRPDRWVVCEFEIENRP